MNRAKPNQLKLLDVAFFEIQNLKQFAKKIKAPPKIINDINGDHKKKVCPHQGAHKISSFNLQGKDNEFCEHTVHSTSEIIRFIEKLSPLDFTNNNIQRISSQLQITEIHFRSLINSVYRNKYGL